MTGQNVFAGTTISQMNITYLNSIVKNLWRARFIVIRNVQWILPCAIISKSIKGTTGRRRFRIIEESPAS
jgi:hypothetical protein